MNIVTVSVVLGSACIVGLVMLSVWWMIYWYVIRHHRRFLDRLSVVFRSPSADFASLLDEARQIDAWFSSRVLYRTSPISSLVSCVQKRQEWHRYLSDETAFRTDWIACGVHERSYLNLVSFFRRAAILDERYQALQEKSRIVLEKRKPLYAELCEAVAKEHLHRLSLEERVHAALERHGVAVMSVADLVEKKGHETPTDEEADLTSLKDVDDKDTN